MKRFLFFIALLFATSLAMSQTTISMNGIQTETGCDFVVYDHGGLFGDYGNNRNDMLTLYSNNTNAACIQISVILADFDIHPSDTIYFYDGTTDADSLLLGKLNNDMVANVTANNIVYTATVHNSTGALTIKFVSDADSCGSGFVINTECVAPCQRVEVSIDSVLSSHYPTQDVDGYYYINLCPYDTLHIVTYGTYPDNNFSYNQNDPTSTFSYDMGLETIDTVGGSTLDYYFTPGRGYDVSIMIEDSAGCASTMPVTFRVRTSENPIRGLSAMPEVCSGQTIHFTTGYDLLSNVQVDTVGSEQATSMKVTDTVFIPDGIDCGNGCSYQSPVTFTAFAPSATITSADDILYVRAKMEHTYIGDIFIGLSCPNGNMAKIMKKYGGSGSANCAGSIPQPWGWNVTSGVTSSGDFGVAISGTTGCLGNNMGTTWNYCWSNNTSPTYGYQYASGSGYVYESVNMTSSRVDSTDVANMTQVYHPDDPFSSLIGCPLNGTWAITIIDGWSGDDGYITEWEMALDPALLPQDWSYHVVVDHTELIGPGAEGEYVVPDSSGVLTYIVRVVDEYGCIYDTTTTITVTPAPQPDLGSDFNLCHGEMVTLSADYDEPNTVYQWNTGDETEEILVLSEGTYTLTVATSNDAGTLTCSGSDTINVGIYEAPQLDFSVNDTSGCSPLTLRFTNNSTPTNAEFQWYLLYEDGTSAYSSLQNSPSFVMDEPGIYSLVLKATTADGCQDSIALWSFFEVYAQPIAEFQADPEISLMGETNGLVNFINYSDSTILEDPTASFYWDFDDGERETETFSPSHTFSEWGDYDVTLYIETGAGCTSEIVHTVVIEQDLVFPNVITPNGDGYNDVFAIENLNTNIDYEDPDGYRNNNLYIYDRWGKRVYAAKNYDTFAKNGTIQQGSQYFDGANLADGVYYYSFYYKGKAKTVNYNGSITIIR